MTRIAMASALVSIFLVVAVWVVVLNWWYKVESNRNVHRGIDRRHSMVPVVAQVLVLIAALIESQFGAMISSGIFWVIALSDPSFWGLLFTTVSLLSRRLR